MKTLGLCVGPTFPFAAWTSYFGTSMWYPSFRVSNWTGPKSIHNRANLSHIIQLDSEDILHMNAVNSGVDNACPHFNIMIPKVRINSESTCTVIRHVRSDFVTDKFVICERTICVIRQFTLVEIDLTCDGDEYQVK